MNDERFGALLKEIDENPERHDQSAWIRGLLSYTYTWNEETETHIPQRIKEYEGQLINCGTTGCLAGLGSLRYAPVGTKFWQNKLILPDGTDIDYEDYGQEVLELSPSEALYLFSAYRDMDEIKDYYNKTKEERATFLSRYYD